MSGARGSAPAPTLPLNIEETVRSIARLHADYYEKATPVQRAIDRLTSLLVRPGFTVCLTSLVGFWIGINLLGPALGYNFGDPPPFPSLTGIASLVSLYIALLILTTQRREYQLARYREQLTLELTILCEQKTTKIIKLLEEARRDNPLIHDRIDEEAEAMAQSADHHAVHEAIRETHAEAERIGGHLASASRSRDLPPRTPAD